MIVPTATNLKLKFPEFATLDDATVEFAIEEAALFVDDSWLVDTQTLGILYLAAHRLMISQMAAMSATGQIVQSERMGEMSVTYAQVPQASAAVDVSDFSITWYGRRYMELAHINNPPIAVI
jgi:hypothetical protein